MSNLPSSWLEFGFLDLLDVQGGIQPPKSTFVYAPEPGHVPLLQIRDFGDRPVPTYILDSEKLKKCNSNDILIARYGDSLGKILTGQEGAYNVAMVKVVAPDGVSRDFLYFLLNSEIFQAPLRLISRSAQNGFNKEDLKGVILPIPPVAEQRRIAAKLQALLGRVDACRTRLNRFQLIIKRFRQSVIRAAISGKLTCDWRQDDEGPSEWEEVNLGDLMETRPRNGYSPRPVAFETPVRSLTLTATTSGKFRGEHFKFIDEKLPDSSPLWLRPGDILIQRSNRIEKVGVSAIFDGPVHTYIYPDLMMKCRSNRRTTTEFLHLLLQSDEVRSYFRENATGTSGGMPKINRQVVMSAPVLLPSLPEQLEIVRRVEELFAYADRIEAGTSSARAQIDRLSPSILAKAFRGELVPQDPNDKPARALLKRLRQSNGGPS